MVGARGTGKTTHQKKIIKRYADNGGRVLILPSSKYEPTFKRVPRIKIQKIATFNGIAAIDIEDDAHLAKVLDRCDKLLLVADDVKGYMHRANIHPKVRQGLISSRHRKVDIIFACHGFTQVPPDLFLYIDLIWCFRTDDSPKRQRDKFRDLDNILEVQERVRRQAQSNPYHVEIINNQT